MNSIEMTRILLKELGKTGGYDYAPLPVLK
jgi:hypothetical protein